jgi:hypothetical protein
MSDNMDWEQGGSVAVWVGDFSSQDEFDSYFEENIDEDLDVEKPINKFASDIEFGFYDHDRQEAERFDTNLSVIKLLAPFSNSASFASEAALAAAEKGITEANTVILLFDCIYRQTTSADAPIKFIGNFNYE